MAVLAVLMLISSSKSSISLYGDNTTRQTISQVNQEIENLKVQEKRAQSLQQVEQSPVKEAMVPSTDVQFVEKGDVAGASTAQPVAEATAQP